MVFANLVRHSMQYTRDLFMWFLEIKLLDHRQQITNSNRNKRGARREQEFLDSVDVERIIFQGFHMIQ